VISVLQANLLRALYSRGKVYPAFAQPDGKERELAEALIDTYSMMVGMRKGVLEDAVKEIEVGRDYRLVRGLSSLLERRCRFEAHAKVDPFRARSSVFRASAGRYTDRDLVLKEVANELGVSPADLEESLWADLDENLTLVDFQPIDAGELIREYNLSLAQTLLFRSSFMEFSVSDHWKEVFRGVKAFGLMYTALNTSEGVRVRVEGPLSLTKLTDRYGVAIAKLFELIVMASRWDIKAQVLGANRGRVYDLQLSSSHHGQLLSAGRQWSTGTFDSSVEERFFSDFVSLGSGWEIRREPEPLIVGQHVFIPDFSFEKYGHKVYMEIVGFWTPSYLKLKEEKLRQLQGIDIIVAVDEELGASRGSFKASDFLVFKGRVPAEKVYSYLKEEEEKLVKDVLSKQKLDLEDVTRRGLVVNLTEIAEERGVPLRAIREMLPDEVLRRYSLIGEELVSRDYISKLKGEIGDLEGKSFSEVQGKVQKMGIKDVDGLLRELGYKVIWASLDPADAKVERIEE